MKKLIAIVIIALASTSLAQTSVTNHVNELAGHLSLLRIDCPPGTGPILTSRPVLCFKQAYSDPDLFRMMWDMFNDPLFVTTASTAAEPWALDAATGASYRTFTLGGVGTFTVVHVLEGTDGIIRVGTAQR